MTWEDPWLAARWPFVLQHLPPVPARVVEIGCGPAGGFVPALTRAGYDAVGVDPEAPDAPGYVRTEFERYDPGQADAVVACTSLHHVADLDEVLNRVAGALTPQGTLVVVEWAWERLDEATARWGFAQVARAPIGSEPTWLHRCEDEWVTSGLPWEVCLRAWTGEAGLHTCDAILTALDTRFERRHFSPGPYLFPDLADTSEADEQAAIDAGHIRATGLRYVGRRRPDDDGL
ncbi:MAG: class I SAM-dependent methyltransferase [Actinomycetes bacterium]